MFEIDITFHGVDLFCGYEKIYYKVNVNNLAIMSYNFSTQIFEKWKEDKDDKIIEKKRNLKKGETMTLKEKQEEERRKKKDAEGAFVGWCVHIVHTYSISLFTQKRHSSALQAANIALCNANTN